MKCNTIQQTVFGFFGRGYDTQYLRWYFSGHDEAAIVQCEYCIDDNIIVHAYWETKIIVHAYWETNLSYCYADIDLYPGSQ